MRTIIVQIPTYTVGIFYLTKISKNAIIIINMAEEKYDLVMLLMSTQRAWEGGINNRNLQILNQLRQHPKIRNILTIDFLPPTYYRALARGGRDIFPGWLDKRTISRGPFSNLKQINPHEWNATSIMPVISPKFFWQTIKSNLKALGFNENKLISWSYDPLNPEFFDQWPHSFKVFDAVDNWAAHQSHLKRAEKLMENYCAIGEKADVIFMVNEALLTLFPKTKNAITIYNGVDNNFFAEKSKIVPRELLEARRPIIGYIGILEARVDTDLLLDVINKNPDKTVAIIGGTLSRMPWQKKTFNPKVLKKFKNVVWCGRVPYNEMNLFVHSFDVAIVPHKITALTKSMDPMKIYEYLAAGKPVVTTSVVDHKKFKGLIYSAKNNTEFISMINEALTNDNDGARAKRQELARHFSWTNRFSEMEKFLPLT